MEEAEASVKGSTEGLGCLFLELEFFQGQGYCVDVQWDVAHRCDFFYFFFTDS